MFSVKISSCHHESDGQEVWPDKVEGKLLDIGDNGKANRNRGHGKCSNRDYLASDSDYSFDVRFFSVHFLSSANV